MPLPRSLVAVLLCAACGRTPLLGPQARDGGAPRTDAGLKIDGTLDSTSDTSRPDTRPPDSTPSVACAALTSLASHGVLTSRHARQVLFAKDRSAVVLRVAGRDAGTEDEVLVVRLPGGEISSLGIGAIDIGWIDDGARLLLRNHAGDLTASSLDGVDRLTLARGTCEHLTSPDGKRVLAFLDCDRLTATLASVDTRSGAHTTLGRSTRKDYGYGPNVDFSPGGKWLAFLEAPPAHDGGVSYNGIVRVVDSRNVSYALDSAGIASNPHFVSDEVLLFVKKRSSTFTVDLRAHALGKGETSWVVAQEVNFDGRFDRRVSSDGQWFLATVSPLPTDYRSRDALSAYALDGRQTALANDVFPFLASEMLWYSFAFAADDRHVVYQRLTPSTLGVSVVGLAGGAATSLSPDSSFVIPPVGNLVALNETRSQPFRLRLTNLETTQNVAETRLNAPAQVVTFTPNGTSVVFAEQAEGAKLVRLRHLSGRTGLTTDLAQWNETQMPTDNTCCNLPGPGYPIDPTGCYTIVDSDLLGGTALILLPP